MFWLLIRVRFGQLLGGSAPLLRVPSIFLSEIFRRRIQSHQRLFMVALPIVYKKGLRRYWRTCWLSLHNLASSVTSDIFGGYPLLSLNNLIIAHSSGGVLFGLFVPCYPRSLRWFPRLSEGIALLCLRESSPCLLFISSHYVEGINRLIDIPKGYQFSWGFSEVLRGTDPQLQSNVPENPHLSFCFPCLVTDKVSMVCFPSLRQDF